MLQAFYSLFVLYCLALRLLSHLLLALSFLCQMSISIEQYRSAIGNFHGFIVSKELCYLVKLIRSALSLYKFYGNTFPKIMFNISYKLFVISALLLLAGNVKPTVWNFEICGHLIEDFSLNSSLRIKISSEYCY